MLPRLHHYSWQHADDCATWSAFTRPGMFLSRLSLFNAICFLQAVKMQASVAHDSHDPAHISFKPGDVVVQLGDADPATGMAKGSCVDHPLTCVHYRRVPTSPTVSQRVCLVNRCRGSVDRASLFTFLCLLARVRYAPGRYDGPFPGG